MLVSIILTVSLYLSICLLGQIVFAAAKIAKFRTGLVPTVLVILVSISWGVFYYLTR